MKKPRSLWALLLACILSGCQSAGAERVQAGKALYEEKCRTVAGEKIYRKVEGVEGVLLLKVRPFGGEAKWADPDWPCAAFAHESSGDNYINTFLWYEQPTTTRTRSLDTRRSDLPGYRYVDIVDAKDGKRYRYTGSKKPVGKKDVVSPDVRYRLQADPNFDLDVYRWTLDRAPAPNSAPRYGVTFEDHVIPEERALGIASSTVRVIDLATNEVLGEMTRYVWSPSRPSPVNPSPWLTAQSCRNYTGVQMTRFFVDQVLIPVKEQ